MTPEEKARVAAEDAYPSDDANTPEYVREHARACYALGFLAGRAEGVKDAMRWRDPVKEPPSIGESLQILDMVQLTRRLHEIYLPSEEVRDVFVKNWGARYLWREIGPLPEVKP